MDSDYAGGPVTPSDFEIRIRGRITKSSRAAFGDLTVTVSPVETIVRGTVVDQAALYGILERIQMLGLELIEVRRIVPPAGQ